MLFAKQLEEVISAAEGLQERGRPRRGEPSMSIRLWRDRADSQVPTEPLDGDNRRSNGRAPSVERPIVAICASPRARR
jgi:hypothetical protein